LAFKNFASGLYLFGWDSLHPEFGFFDSLVRAFSGVWREEQGLGTIAAHAHMTELPRLIILGFLSLFLDTELIRWAFMFLCLVLGPFGVYYFLLYVFRKEKEDFGTNLSALLGSLFYLLNLGTLQHFFVPFEMFPIQFAALPWLFYLILKILRENKKRNLVTLFAISLFASGMAYAPTLFYAYFGGVSIFLLVYWVSSKFSSATFKKSFLILITILISNSFWLLPNFYSIKNQSEIVSNSNINRLFSPEAFLRNEEYGNIENVLIFKNFLFDWRAFDFESNSFSDLMVDWNNHLGDPRVVLIGYSLVSLSLLGALISLLKRDKVGWGMFLVGLFCLFFLVNVNYKSGVIYQYFYENYGVFREGFRMPFTKFSILFSFVLSFYFGYIFFKAGKIATIILSPFILASLFLFMKPAFDGNFISSVVKTSPPREYFELFDFFKNNSGRIAKIPMYTHWGWEYHSWGYEGSGFLTYGISNPLLDRDFDRWSPYNETFYNEASYGLYTKSKDVFKRVLAKYEVNYILLDESVVNAGGSSEILFVPETKQMVTDLGFKEVFRKGALSIYDTGIEVSDFISAPKKYTLINTDLAYSQSDPIYAKYGDYVQSEAGVGYPFVNFDSRGEVTISLNQNLSELIFENKKADLNISLPISEVTNETFGKGRGLPEAFNCDLKKVGTVYKNKNSYRAEGGGVSCDFFDYPELSHDKAYVLRVMGENKQGRSLKIYLQNWKTNKMDVEKLLPNGKFDEYYFVYPQGPGDKGYSLNLETRSFGRIVSENTIETISFYPIDIDYITSLYIDALEDPSKSSDLNILDVKKYGPSIYKIKVFGTGLLKLGQGYEEGWVSFPKLSHVKINSWANGWVVSDEVEGGQITIIYWPQLLEWGGMVLAGIALLTLVRYKLY
jgi:hypothetical protein